MERLHRLLSAELYEVIPHLFAQLGIEVEPEKVRWLWDYPEKRKFLRDNTNNPTFREALEVMEPLFERFVGRSDLHLNNWMIRLTAVGPQLVIIDPFF